MKWVALGNENRDNKRRVDSNSHVGNNWTLINNRRQNMREAASKLGLGDETLGLLAKMRKERNMTMRREAKKKRGWSSPRQRCEAHHPPSLPYKLELFFAVNLGHVCDQLYINNQCPAIWHEFELVGPTMFKNYLGARWGLLPTLQWVGSWLPTYLASSSPVK